MNPVKCLNCNFSTKNEEELIKHTKVHQHLPNFGIKCFRCPQISKIINSHYKHIRSCKGYVKPKTSENFNLIHEEQELVVRFLFLNTTTNTRILLFGISEI